MFGIVKSQLDSIYQFEYHPTHLLADAAYDITNGFILSFSVPEKRDVCWAHVNRKIDDHLRPVEGSARIKIKDDLVKLQVTASSDSFLQAFNLLKDKWFNTNNQNIKDFFNQWLHKYTIGWYESYVEGSTSSNNALESKNNTVKD